MFKEISHKVFSVGGSVRNKIMGKKAKDFDFVVENTSEEEFLAVFPEAKKVGNSFPVFLLKDKDGNEHEVALARTEKSTGVTYQDFEIVSGVSIHEDLGRRDLTINSIAENVLTGELVDPHNGVNDIISRIIRTINVVAFEEDSLRIYRALRFAAEFDFTIEPKTFELMKASRHLLVHIPTERVHAELKKVYERSEIPSVFFELLLQLDALQIHFKPLYVMSKISSGPNKYHNGKTAFEHAMDSFNFAKENGYSFDVALAGLFHDTGKGVTKKVAESEVQHHYGHEVMSYAINKQFVKQHRFTVKQEELILTFARQHMYFHLLEKIKNPIKLVRFFKKIRKHADDIILAANTDHPLNDEKIVILNNLKRSFKEAVIEIPTSIQKSSKEAIVNYVENQYAQKYKEISK